MAKRQPANGSKGGTAPAAAPTTRRPATPAEPAAQRGRQSVAAARSSASGSNRTQAIILGLAVLVMAVIVVVGMIVNKKQNATQGEGYGTAKVATATVSGGVITVSNGTPAKTIDVYEDALCPSCAEFEHQFGQQIAQFADEGKVAVRLHMVNFLDSASASKDYSTRAAGALLAVATEAGNQPGLVLAFHSKLFAEGTQPSESGDADLSNQQLADLAGSLGAPQNAQAAIAAGKYVAQAKASAETNMAEMQAATGEVRTPTILSGGAPVAVNSVDWLTKLVG